MGILDTIPDEVIPAAGPSGPVSAPMAPPVAKVDWGPVDTQKQQQLVEDPEKPIRNWIQGTTIGRIFAGAGLGIARNTTRLGEAIGVAPAGAADAIPQVTAEMPWYEHLASSLLELGIPLGAASKAGKALGIAGKVDSMTGVGGALAKFGYRTGEFAAAAPFAMDVNNSISTVLKDNKQALKDATSPDAIEAITSYTDNLAINKDDTYATKLGKTLLEGAILNEAVRGVVMGTIKGVKAARGIQDPLKPNPEAAEILAARRKANMPDDVIEANNGMLLADTEGRIAGAEAVSDYVRNDGLMGRLFRGIADAAESWRAVTKEAEQLVPGYKGRQSKTELDPWAKQRMFKATGHEVGEYLEKEVLPIFKPIIDDGLLQDFMNYWHLKTVRFRQSQNPKYKSAYDQEIDELGNVTKEGILPKNKQDAIIAFGDSNEKWKAALKTLGEQNSKLLDLAQAKGGLWTEEGLAALKAKITMPNGGFALSLYRIQNPDLVQIGDNFVHRAFRKDPTRRTGGGSDNPNYMDPLEAYVKNAAGIIEAANMNYAKKGGYELINRIAAVNPKEGAKWAVKVVSPERIRMAIAEIKKEAAKAGMEIVETGEKVARKPEFSALEKQVAKDVTAERDKIKNLKGALKDESKAGVQGDAQNMALHNELEDSALDLLMLQKQFIKPTRGKHNIDFVIEDGILQAYEIRDQGLATAIADYGPKAAAITMRIPFVSAAAKNFKSFFTQMVTKNPEYALFSNPIRDSFQAFTMGQMLYSVPFVNIIRGIALQTKKDPMVKEAMKSIGWSTLAHGENDAGKVYAKQFYNMQKQSPMATPRKLWEFWSGITEKLENSVRIDYYNQLRKSGYSPEVAGFHARQISTDFAGSGAYDGIRQMAAVVPFFNASIQGSYRLVKAWEDSFAKGDKSYFKSKMLFGIGLPAMIIHYHNMNDPKYKARPDWERNTNYLFNTNTIREMLHSMTGKYFWEHEPEAEFIKLPKAHEIGMVATIGEKLMESIAKNDGMIVAEAFVKTLLQLVRADSQSSFTPQMLRPFIELGMNSNSLNLPIVPDNLKNTAPETQVQPWTSNTAIALAGMANSATRMLGGAPGTGVSPIALEHLIYGYLGGLGQTIDEFIISPRVGKAMGAPTRPTRNLSEDWFLRRMVSDASPRNSQFVSDLFNMEKRSETAENSVSPIIGKSKANFFKSLSTIEKDKMVEMLKDPKTQEYIAMRPMLRKTMMDIADMNQTIKIIWFSNASPDDKKSQIRQYVQGRNQMAEQVVEAIYGAPQLKNMAVDRDRKTTVGSYIGVRAGLPDNWYEEIKKQFGNLRDSASSLVGK